jgi:ubiquinol-cytochrome c reductase cytochrome c subunit
MPHVCFVLAIIASGLFGAQAALAASAENGKRAYMRAGCWQCHGTVGQGGTAGPRIAPDPLPYDALAAFVRTTNRAMPPYRETVLSNDELADIHAYLASIPKPPPADSLPLLKP